MMTRRGVLFIYSLLLAGCTASGSGNTIPRNVMAVLQNADTFELLSLDPESGPDKQSEAVKNPFHGWAILGKTTIQDSEIRKQLNSALEQGVAEGRAGAPCFDPRHGIHAVRSGRAVDLVICFECGHIYVYFDDAQDATIRTAGSPEPTLDRILKGAGVPLAKKRSEK